MHSIAILSRLTISSRQDTAIKIGSMSGETIAIICLERQELRNHWRSGNGASYVSGSIAGDRLELHLPIRTRRNRLKVLAGV